VWNIEKKIIFCKGKKMKFTYMYAEIHIQRSFFDNKKDI
jgi:hypothetical protein